MSLIRIERVLTLPNPVTGSTIYIVKGNGVSDSEMFFTNNDGTEIRHLLNKADVTGMIDVAINSFNNMYIAQDIAARNALVLDRNVLVLVLNAVGDTTVTTGAALYVYDRVNTVYYKVSEYESMDLTFNLTWSNIVGRPNSLPAAIDSAVAISHSHANITVINRLNETVTGELAYNGAPVQAFVATADW